MAGFNGRGLWPVWSRDGRELFYWTTNANKVMSVNVSTRPSFSVSTPRFVTEIPWVSEVALPYSNYDVSPDGQRFLFFKVNGAVAPSGEIRVILNWDEELKHLTPSGKQP